MAGWLVRGRERLTGWLVLLWHVSIPLNQFEGRHYAPFRCGSKSNAQSSRADEDTVHNLEGKGAVESHKVNNSRISSGLPW